MTAPTQTPPSPDATGLVERLTEIERQSTAPYFGPRKYWQSIIKDLVRECRRLLAANEVWFDDARNAFLETEVERLTAERDEAQAENARWLLRMKAIREASGVGVLPMLSELPDAIAAKMADHIGDADHMIAPLPELSGNPGGLKASALDQLRRAAADLDEAHDMIAGWAEYADEYFQLEHDLPGDLARVKLAAGEARRAHEDAARAGAPSAGHDLREKVAEAINRAMIDGQGDQDIIRLATDDILAIPEIAALQAGEGR